MEQLSLILGMILDSMRHFWPYLILTIPLTVLVRMAKVSGIISRSLGKKPMVSIALAAAVGAFSPLCSSSVIPVIASLLMAGVPLAPVMTFWIASPMMDPETFFLSVPVIGWEMSVWRLSAALMISLLSGYLTHLLTVHGFLSPVVLRKDHCDRKSRWSGWSREEGFISLRRASRIFSRHTGLQPALSGLWSGEKGPAKGECSGGKLSCSIRPVDREDQKVSGGKCHDENRVGTALQGNLWKEGWKASFLALKFMFLAFFMDALVRIYIPDTLLTDFLNGNAALSIFFTTLLGIPLYTSNLTALPLVDGLLSMGMNEGAALAFLLIGPATTLPSLIAVWGIARKKVFFLYLFTTLAGALMAGYLYQLSLMIR